MCVCVEARGRGGGNERGECGGWVAVRSGSSVGVGLIECRHIRLLGQ